MTHIVFSDFWKNHIECSEQSLQDMRMAYVQDSPMPYGIKKIEANIHMLFPGESEAFRLLYNTRGCHMKWVPWPIDTLVPTAISCVGNNKSVEIESAYYGLDASFFTKGYEAWPTMSEIVYSVSGFLCFELGSFLLIFQIVDLCFRYGLCSLQIGKALLLGLYLELGHGQVFLGAAALTSFHIAVTGGSHEVEELILEDAV